MTDAYAREISAMWPTEASDYSAPNAVFGLTGSIEFRVSEASRGNCDRIGHGYLSARPRTSTGR